MVMEVATAPALEGLVAAAARAPSLSVAVVAKVAAMLAVDDLVAEEVVAKVGARVAASQAVVGAAEVHPLATREVCLAAVGLGALMEGCVAAAGVGAPS